VEGTREQNKHRKNPRTVLHYQPIWQR